MDSTRLRIWINFNGIYYHGYQKQSSVTTVQSLLENALLKHFKEAIKTTVAGRTDKNVHADMQIVHCDIKECSTPLDKLSLILNQYLPSQIRVVEIRASSDHFHARFSAKIRMYRYLLASNECNLNRLFLDHVYIVKHQLDVIQMKQYLYPLIGSHDFTSYSNISEKKKISKLTHLHNIREIFHIDVYQKYPLIHIDIYANAFLRNMIRSIIGTLLYACQREKDNLYMYDILKQKDCTLAKQRVDGKGLSLYRIYYTPVFGERSYYKAYSQN